MTFQPFQAICKLLKSLANKIVPSSFQPFQPYCKSLKTNVPTSFQACASNPPIPPYRWEGHLGGARPPIGKGLRNLFVVTADTSLSSLFLHRGRERGNQGLGRRGKVSERRRRRNAHHLELRGNPPLSCEIQARGFDFYCSNDRTEVNVIADIGCQVGCQFGIAPLKSG